MKTRILSVAFASAFALAAFTGSAVADKGGSPNPRACHGQIVSSIVREAGGRTQQEYARFASQLLGRRVTVGDLHKFIKEFCASAPG
ncbi:MAG TPA: hypothetical protein VFK32_05815 [Tepidiformaceae bacterium]|nr:hypothetical protein [Tepidiformaceae bacterium]